jgi:hypothetical protein
MSRDADYCREQAADCAARAEAVTLPEIKAAYRKLRERWLLAAAETDEKWSPVGPGRPSGLQVMRSTPRGERHVPACKKSHLRAASMTPVNFAE